MTAAAKVRKFRKGDTVIVTTGRDKGKKGDILRVMPKEGRAVVQGVNIVHRHMRQSASQQGGIVNKEAPIAVSNLAHVDPASGEATRVGFRTLEDNRKVRFAKRSGEVID